MLVVAIGGIALGTEGSASGIEGILETWQLTETFLGVPVITLLYTLDDIVLILEPLRLGYNDVAVGGVIGSLLFFATANVGIVGLLGTIQFRWETVFVVQFLVCQHLQADCVSLPAVLLVDGYILAGGYLPLWSNYRTPRPARAGPSRTGTSSGRCCSRPSDLQAGTAAGLTTDAARHSSRTGFLSPI